MPELQHMAGTDVISEAPPTNVTSTGLKDFGLDTSKMIPVEEAKPLDVKYEHIEPTDKQKADWQKGISLADQASENLGSMGSQNSGIRFEKSLDKTVDTTTPAVEVVSPNVANEPIIAPKDETPVQKTATTPDASVVQQPKTREELEADTQARLAEIRARNNPIPVPTTQEEHSAKISPETQDVMNKWNKP